MLAGESTLAVGGATCSDIIGIVSFDFGESNREGSGYPSPLKLSIALASADGGATAGNLNPCENDAEPFLLVNGAPPSPGVLGAVAMPGCLREGRSGKVLSEPEAEYDEMRGEGCVADR
jgi:hypothetical protein